MINPLGVETWQSRAGPDLNDSKEPTKHEECMEAEISGLREHLGARKVSPATKPLQHDIDIIKELKRQFVDTMIARGIQYNTAGAVTGLMNVMLADLEEQTR